MVIKNILEGISERVGRIISWLAFVLVILVSIDVFMRYVFSISKAWYLELEWHTFALLFLVSMAYTLKHNGHVRVDVFYDNYSKKRKALIDVIGHLFLLVPWCLIIIFTSYHYGFNSFHISESSPDPGGLPFRFIIKWSIALSFILLLIQALAEIIKAGEILISKD